MFFAAVFMKSTVNLIKNDRKKTKGDNMTDETIKIHTFCFNKQDNGGESLILVTKLVHNGDEKRPNIYWNQEISLQSYMNSASIYLDGISITPQLLRQCADELEKAEQEAQAILDARGVNSVKQP